MVVFNLWLLGNVNKHTSQNLGQEQVLKEVFLPFFALQALHLALVKADVKQLWKVAIYSQKKKKKKRPREPKNTGGTGASRNRLLPRHLRTLGILRHSTCAPSSAGPQWKHHGPGRQILHKHADPCSPKSKCEGFK